MMAEDATPRRVLEQLYGELGAHSTEVSTEVSTDTVVLLAQSQSTLSARADRSLSFLCLSRILLHSAAVENAAFADAARPYVLSTVCRDDGGADEQEASTTLAHFLAAVFSLSPPTAVALVTTPVPGDEDTQRPADVLDVLLEMAELQSGPQLAVAEMLSQAASSKPGRQVVERAQEWLRGALDFEGDATLGAVAAVALSKLGGGAHVAPEEQDALTDAALPDSAVAEQVALCSKMVDLVVSTRASEKSLPSSSLLSTLQGLGILSTKGHIKHVLATFPRFLSALLALSPVPDTRPGSLPAAPGGKLDFNDAQLSAPVETSLCYGISTILANLVASKPVLSAQEQQVAKLGAMAISGTKSGLQAHTDDDPYETDEAIQTRVSAVVNAGAVPALRGLVRADSLGVKETLGRLCLSLVENKQYRTRFVRDGGFRVLGSLLRDLVPSKPATAGQDAGKLHLPACQALAKLVITTPPHLLFPPPHMTTALNALTPLYHLLCAPSASLLQTFEALMALTNLASIDPSFSDRIVTATVPLGSTDTMWKGSGSTTDRDIKVIARVEDLLLDTNTLVRRAATELVCNLVSCSAGHAFFAAGTADSVSRAIARLNILIVLSSVDDTPTRLAAGGALALVTEDPVACSNLVSVPDQSRVGKEPRSIWTRLLGMFSADAPEVDEYGDEIPVVSSSEPNIGLIHRAVVILFNLVNYAVGLDDKDRTRVLNEAKTAGVVDKLANVLETVTDREVLEPAVECLKVLKRYPTK